MSLLDLWAKSRVQFLQGDSRLILPTLPEKSFHCCVTSPPYFGLRDYGHDGQIGLEQTPQAYVDELVAVFREVRRVLRDDGTLWLNLGDSYAANRSYQVSQSKHLVHDYGKSNAAKVPDGLKPKDLIGIPWRVAFALQADGWYLRQDIIWHKPNPMPESVRDRCTKAHEYVFLLSKSPTYYFDAEAIREDAETRALSSWKKRKGKEPIRRGDPSVSEHVTTTATLASREGRNKRSVWTVTPQPYKEAHFATFPPALIEPCVLAGCPPRGDVLDPFGGAGTTGLVAQRLGRNATLVELNPDYVELARRRVSGG